MCAFFLDHSSLKTNAYDYPHPRAYIRFAPTARLHDPDPKGGNYRRLKTQCEHREKEVW